MPSSGNRALRLQEIPDQFFSVIGFLVPKLNLVAKEECGIDIGSLMVLLHLQTAGREWENRRTMLRQDLTTLLVNRGFNEPAVTRLLQSLETQHLIQRVVIPLPVRQELFLSPGGNKLAVAITPAGVRKMDDFIGVLRAHFGHWLKDQPPVMRVWLKQLLPKAMELAQALIERLAAGDTK